MPKAACFIAVGEPGVRVQMVSNNPHVPGESVHVPWYGYRDVTDWSSRPDEGSAELSEVGSGAGWRAVVDES